MCNDSSSSIWIAGSVGDVCAGRGMCVNDQCICDAMWTGQSDYFPLNSCQNPIVLDKLMWSFTAFMLLTLLLRSFPIFVHQHSIYRQNLVKKNTNSMHQHRRMFMAYSCVFLIALPVQIATCIARSVMDFHFGVDLGITLSYVFSFGVFMGGVAVIEHQVFQITVMGASKMGLGKHTLEIVQHDKRFKIVGTIFYCLVIATTQLVQVFLPQGPTPARIVLVLVGNAGTVLYFVHYWFSHAKLSKELETLLSSDFIRGDGGKFARVLLDMKRATQLKRTRMIVLFVLTLVFSVVPPLFAFNYVLKSFMLGLSGGSGHPLLMLTRSSKSKGSASGDKTSDVHNNNTATNQNTVTDGGGNKVPATAFSTVGPSPLVLDETTF